MLTATYSIVALKLEQKKVRWNFSTLQSYILCSIKNLKNASGIEIESMLNRLSQFENYCQQRKVKIFVIPALRNITHEADTLLDELESLSAASLAILRSLRAKLQQAISKGALMVDEVCASIQLCCSNIYQRLRKEEELVAIAERVIPGEAWFGIAASFMSHDVKSGKLLIPQAQDEEE